MDKSTPDDFSNLPKLSICIPTYNRSKFLSIALESIALHANRPDIEVFICDNCSTDDTADMVRNYMQRIPSLRYFCNPLNIGVDRNLLKVLELATGSYCWTLGSDDAVTPEAVGAIFSSMDSSPDMIIADAVNCDFNLQPTGLLNFVSLSDCTLDFSVPKDIVKFLANATMHASLFGYLGALVFRRESLSKVVVNNFYIGAGYILVSRALDILVLRGGSLRYLSTPIAMARRDNNDDVDKTGALLRHFIDYQMFMRSLEHYFSSDLEIHNSYKAYIRRIYGLTGNASAPTGLEFVDTFRELFRTDDIALPPKSYALTAQVYEARQRFIASNMLDTVFSPGVTLHIGFRNDFDMSTRPINERAIGYDRHYWASSDGTRLPFESDSLDAVWGNCCLNQMVRPVDSIREWFRVTKSGGFIVITCPLTEKREATDATPSDSAPLTLESCLGLVSQAVRGVDCRIVHTAQTAYRHAGTDGTKRSEIDIVLEKTWSAPAASASTLDQAMNSHQAGDFEAAALLYQRILASRPEDFVATHMLGVIHFQRSQFAPAEVLLRRAIAINNLTPEAYYNLGCVLQATARDAEARACFEQSLRLNSGFELPRARLSELRLEPTE
jgi:abequosyltransferase